jgi:hypothetical protein
MILGAAVDFGTPGLGLGERALGRRCQRRAFGRTGFACRRGDGT